MLDLIAGQLGKLAIRGVDGGPTPAVTSESIAAAVGSLVTSGAIAPGDQLPTVRALAAHLGVSPSTVTETWRLLRNHRVIETDRRRGTTVRSHRGQISGRYWQVPVARDVLALDLSVGTPDPLLLPDLRGFLSAMSESPPVTSYLDEPTVPELEALLRADWPFTPEAMTIVDGAQDALDRIVDAVIGLGDAVIVEEPTFPPILDMLDLAGARVIAIPVDEAGIEPAAVREAMALEPVAAFVQPRAHNPTGVSWTPQRCAELAEIFAGHPNLLLVEDDHSGPIAGADLYSLGDRLPKQTVHIRSFSKSHGPDLRLAAIGGAAPAIDQVVLRRRLGPSWTSRLIQHLLLAMLNDDATNRQLADAAGVYAQRRSKIASALGAGGVEVADGHGLNLWVPVANETATTVALAANGIGVALGSPFHYTSTPQHHIRVTAGLVQTDHTTIATHLTAAA